MRRNRLNEGKEEKEEDEEEEDEEIEVTATRGAAAAAAGRHRGRNRAIDQRLELKEGRKGESKTKMNERVKKA